MADPPRLRLAVEDLTPAEREEIQELYTRQYLGRLRRQRFTSLVRQGFPGWRARLYCRRSTLAWPPKTRGGRLPRVF